MGFVADHSLDRGRIVISKDGGIIAVAPSVDALVLISQALVVGDELRANPLTMWNVRLWIRRDAKRRAEK
ncbi:MULTISPECIES: hypothetical protein [Bradyrhizobium]|uniref:Uncharacterized protein n=1 Tax=Bradyrhizobium elkanii TaxID=29448 RepID=A0A8I1Y9I4_BRAEL|nr:hypothetical protein [Bradyrhizobium elkanii]MBP1294296.1 hypothetical protein [Bradyrhizobium elkanii]